jgi:hypothetical protein
MAGKCRWVAGTAVLTFILAVQPLEAQRGRGARGAGALGSGGPFLGQSVNLALQNQEQLQLSQDQVAQLQDMKAILDGEVAGLSEEMTALRESMRAGGVEWDEGQRQMGVLRGELISAASPLQGRVQEILTVEQHNKLQPMVRQNRPGLGRGPAAQGRIGISVRGRAGAGRGIGQPRGILGSVGRRPGFDGQGRAPALGIRRGFSGAQVGPKGRRAPLIRRGIGGRVPVPGEGGDLF